MVIAKYRQLQQIVLVIVKDVDGFVERLIDDLCEFDEKRWIARAVDGRRFEPQLKTVVRSADERRVNQQRANTVHFSMNHDAYVQ